MNFKHVFYDTGPEGETLVETIPLGQVESELDYPYQGFKTKKPSPREVAKHARLIYEADLSCPIILSAKGIVMDGIHRIAKSWLLGRETIDAVRFSQDPEPDARIENP